MTEMPNTAAVIEWTLGDRLAKSRKVAGLTQQEMADRLLTSRQTVNTWENDAHRPPARKVMAWALATGVPVDWIVRGTDTTGWLSAHVPQPRGRIGHGILGSWDHHYPPLRALAPTG